ncbi:MAG: NAD(P)H-hydrate epimerase, partial [Roseovarius sp.]|nr:NAD(P)H-hydrate epimerase [Roseovarius sp.]
MTELLTAAQMRAIEARAIESGEVTGRELMERAGRGVVDAALGEWPELARAPDRAVVLCGPGNNGGDGFVVARLLADRGWQVEVFLYGDAEKLPPDARANYRRWQEAGPVRPLEALDMDAVRDARLLVDAIFGTGLSRPLDADLSRLVTAIAHHAALPRAHVVAIDMPSGFCSDSGRALFRPEGPDSDAPYRPHAHLTVTFERPRLGHHLGPAAAASGRGVVV